MAVVALQQEAGAAAHDTKSQAARSLSEHARLSELGRRWLMRPNSAGGHGCAFAITEGWGDGRGEHPDAIGWRRSPIDGGTILVEAKVSRADFLADARKPHRQAPELGVGRFRYFLCPEGLISPQELPPRWGLLYAGPRGSVRAVAGPAAVLRHARRGAPLVSPDGCVVSGYDAWRQACEAFAFSSRNHDLETAMLVALVQRVGDAEATNRRLRELNAQVAFLARELQALRTRFNAQTWELLAARHAVEEAGLQVGPREHTATPRMRKANDA